MTKPTTTTSTATTEAAEVWKEIVLWSRAHGVQLTELRVGDVHATLIDAAPRAPAPAKPQTDDEARESIYGRYGGEMLAEAIEKLKQERGGEDDDEEEQG